jgi:hypothetical protein
MSYLNKKNKIILAIFSSFIFLLSFFSLSNSLALASEYQRCESGSSCTIGEFLYDDDGLATTTPECTFTSRDPDGNLILNNVSITAEIDGWYSYSSTTVNGVEGLYRSYICCDIEDSQMCIDKSFEIGPSFLSSEDVASAVLNASTTDYTATGTIGANLQNPVLSATSTASAVWTYTDRSLTSFGTLVADIWSNEVRDLTTRKIASSSEYIAGVTASGTVSQVANEVDQTITKYNVELIRGATFDFAGFADTGSTTAMTDSELNQPTGYWDNYVLQMMSGANSGEEKVVVSFDGDTNTLTLSSAFTFPISPNDKYILKHEDRLVYKIWNSTTRTLTSAANIASDIWNYTGGRTLTTLSNVASDVWDNNFAPNRLLTSDWSVEMSDLDQLIIGKTYRAKVFVTNASSTPADSLVAPTITLYDASRNVVVADITMTRLSEGVYEYIYVIPPTAAQGLWEAITFTEVESGKIIQTNDYWSVEGSPAQVIINSITNAVVPDVNANVTITNEGLTGYEYHYEWCVVSGIDNACGGGDDTYYASASKYINAGTDWNTDLSATISTAGNYFFKLVVYYGTEKSGASRVFTATAGGTPPSGGGGGTPAKICNGADFNSDKSVNSVDFSILLAFWKTAFPFKNPCVDINADKKVDSIDFSILMYQWGTKK